MKVKQLISELKKMPQDADVYTADHDHSEWETNGLVSLVWLINQDEDFPDGSNGRKCLEEDYGLFKIDEPYVVLKV